MIASSVANHAADAYARIRIPAAESTITSGRASTSELAIKASVGPDVLLRQLRSGRATAEVATATGPTAEAHGSTKGKPAATFTRTGAVGDQAAIAEAPVPAMVNQAIPGAVRLSA